MTSFLRHGKKAGTALAGGIVILVGVIMIPYPGPGWLVVFAGFAILSTEFEFAEKALKQLRAKYNQWKIWLVQQPRMVQLAVLAFTGLVVLVTIWLLNTFGFIDSFFSLHQDWLHSPFDSRK